MSVYFAQAKDGGPIKIGHSNQFKSRKSGLDALFPYGVELLCEVEGDYVTEFFLHNCFEPLRIRGEWYRNALPIWRFIAEVEDHGRPEWLPPRSCAGIDFKAMAVTAFGHPKAAMAACGYSDFTNFGDVIGASGASGRGNARLLIAAARDAGDLPSYLPAKESA